MEIMQWFHFCVKKVDLCCLWHKHIVSISAEAGSAHALSEMRTVQRPEAHRSHLKSVQFCQQPNNFAFKNMITTKNIYSSSFCI